MPVIYLTKTQEREARTERVLREGLLEQSMTHRDFCLRKTA